jgi:hypothetical protein
MAPGALFGTRTGIRRLFWVEAGGRAMVDGVVFALRRLLHLDADACGAYRQALKAISDHDVRLRLAWFWRDHERHVDDLAAEIRRLGDAPPQVRRDALGIVVEGYTALRSRMSAVGALRALKSSEMLTNAAYDAALRFDLPPETRRLIEANRADGAGHRTYIDDLLSTPPAGLFRPRVPLWDAAVVAAVIGTSLALAGAALVLASRRPVGVPAPRQRREIARRPHRRYVPEPRESKAALGAAVASQRA